MRGGSKALKIRYAKIFKNVSDVGTKLVNFDYSPAQDEYYTFVKKHCDEGFRQIIITSEIMIELVKHYFINRNFRISNIEFMIDDDSLTSEIRTIIEKLNIDRAYLGQLIDKLKFLIEESSIDLKKIEMKGKTENSASISMFLQVNGVFGVTDNCYEEESSVLIDKIAECIRI